MRKILSRKRIICDCCSSIVGHAVITGSTSGIGLATARELARRNWTVTLACRDVHSAKQVKQSIATETGNLKLNVEPLDLSSRDSIDGFTAKMSTTPIHVLINNAGVMASSPQLSSSFGNVDIDTATNYLGPFYLTQSLMPSLKLTCDSQTFYPRVIFVGSSLAKQGSVEQLLRPWPEQAVWNTSQQYANSKLALCLYARELHSQLGSLSDGVIYTYSLFTGGMVDTQLSRHVLSTYPSILRRIFRLLSTLFLQSPETACNTVVHCAVSPNVPGAHLSSECYNGHPSGCGMLYSNCTPIEWPPMMQDLSKAHQLFNDTRKHLGLTS